MGNKIVGIRYIGKKDRQEDTVCKTGAVWIPGQVHNFSEKLATALLVHTDSFESADISMDGGTYLSRGDRNRKEQGVATFVNLAAMGVEQMVHMARLEFDRVVNPEGKTEAEVRREVHGLMANHNLDLEALRKLEPTSNGSVQVPYMATPEEYAALMAGTVVLAIVPAEVATFQQQPPCDNDHVAPGCEQFGSETQPDDEQKGAAVDPEAKPLPDLLASLEKPELMAFAKQEGVTFSNAFTAEKLRERIFAELSERAQLKEAA